MMTATEFAMTVLGAFGFACVLAIQFGLEATINILAAICLGMLLSAWGQLS